MFICLSLWVIVLCFNSFFKFSTTLQTARFQDWISLILFSPSCSFSLRIQFQTYKSCFFWVIFQRFSMFFSKKAFPLSIDMHERRFLPAVDCSLIFKLISSFFSFQVYSRSQQYFFQNFFYFICSLICSSFYFWAYGYDFFELVINCDPKLNPDPKSKEVDVESFLFWLFFFFCLDLAFYPFLMNYGPSLGLLLVRDPIAPFLRCPSSPSFLLLYFCLISSIRSTSLLFSSLRCWISTSISLILVVLLSRLSSMMVSSCCLILRLSSSMIFLSLRTMVKFQIQIPFSSMSFLTLSDFFINDLLIGLVVWQIALSDGINYVWQRFIKFFYLQSQAQKLNILVLILVQAQ